MENEDFHDGYRKFFQDLGTGTSRVPSEGIPSSGYDVARTQYFNRILIKNGIKL